MSAFLVFAVVLTLVLIVYYAVMIALDLKRQGKKPPTSKEEFDVSSMQEVDDAFAVDESRFKLPDTAVEQEKVEDTKADEQQVAVPVTPSKPSEAARTIERVEEKMEAITPETSGGVDSDEMTRLILEGALFGPKFRPKKSK
ncbi:MAG: hypothetical protein II544_04210 [Spirochaetales bacterium]|nr:hypothetical protein [Spirochaetales bacterium]